MRPDAILFDCDGVIADSEGIASRIMAEEITALGWPMTPEEEQRLFVGKPVSAMHEILVPRVGPLPEGWYPRILTRIVAAMETELTPIPGVMDVLHRFRDVGLPMAVASNSSRSELDTKVRRLDLGVFFPGRMFSHEDVGAPKPAPDLYLVAAAACGVAPARCVVVEDTPTGATAGIAAGCRVLGYAPHGMPGLAETGALIFRDMAELPGLLGLTPA